MTTPSATLLNILGEQRHPSLKVSLALESLEVACQQIGELDAAYEARRRELVIERDELLKDAAESGVAIRFLQVISGLSRTAIWTARAGGRND